MYRSLPDQGRTPDSGRLDTRIGWRDIPPNQTQDGLYLTQDGSSGVQDVKDPDAGGQEESRRLVILTQKKENSIESPLNVFT